MKTKKKKNSEHTPINSHQTQLTLYESCTNPLSTTAKNCKIKNDNIRVKTWCV